MYAILCVMDHEPETGLSEGEEDLLNDMGEPGTGDAIYRAHRQDQAEHPAESA
jgi:hypothetical protein